MAYDPLKYLTRAVEDALEAAGDLDPATVHLSVVRDLRSKVKELQATVEQKAEAALSQIKTNLQARAEREVDACVREKMAAFEEGYEFYRNQRNQGEAQ